MCYVGVGVDQTWLRKFPWKNAIILASGMFEKMQCMSSCTTL